MTVVRVVMIVGLVTVVPVVMVMVRGVGGRTGTTVVRVVMVMVRGVGGRTGTTVVRVVTTVRPLQSHRFLSQKDWSFPCSTATRGLDFVGSPKKMLSLWACTLSPQDNLLTPTQNLPTNTHKKHSNVVVESTS